MLSAVLHKPLSRSYRLGPYRTIKPTAMVSQPALAASCLMGRGIVELADIIFRLG
jgi:hypothetical protein